MRLQHVLSAADNSLAAKRAVLAISAELYHAFEEIALAKQVSQALIGDAPGEKWCRGNIHAR